MAYELGTPVALSNGGFVVLTTATAGGETVLSAQRYDPLMQPLGAPIRIASGFYLNGGTQLGPFDVEPTSTGGFAVAVGFTTSSRFGGPVTQSVVVSSYGADGSPLIAGAGTPVTQLSGFEVAPLFDGGLALLHPSYGGGSMSLTLFNAQGALSNQVVLSATPTTITPLAGAVALGWTAGGLIHQEVRHAATGAVLSPDAMVTVRTGTDGADVLAGSGGPDSLSGGLGDDVLYGGPGWDVLSGGAGADKFLVSVDGSVDRIDFSVAQGDLILLLDGSGNIASGAGGLLIWNQATHALAYDADSDAGPALAVTVASIDVSAGMLGRASFAAGFQPSGLRTIALDGTRTDTVFDWGAQAFDTATAVFTPAGELKSYEVRYDSGAVSLRTNDIGDLTPDWDTVVAETDAQGRLFAYSVFHDDGARTLWLFDTQNAHAWSRVIESYDALGRLQVQAAANDDGSAWERHIDTYDQHPWAYYIENFQAGARLNLTFYNADGTVIS